MPPTNRLISFFCARHPSRMRRLVGRLAAALVLLGVAQGDAGGALYTVETKEIITTLERNHVRDDRRLVAVGGLGRAARGRMAPLLSRPAAPAPSLLRLCVCSVPSPHSPRPPRRRRRFVAALSDATHDATRRDDACDRDSRSLARAAGRAVPPARTHTHTHARTRRASRASIRRSTSRWSAAISTCVLHDMT